MTTFKRSSLGYLSGLLLIGASSTLVACGGDGANASGGTGGDEPGAAGQTDVGTGGSSGKGAGSGGSASNAGSSGTKSGAGSSGDGSAGSGTVGSGTAGSGSGGSSSAGSAGSTSSGGSSNNAGKGGSASGGSGSTDGNVNADYSVASFGYDAPEGPDHPLTAVETKILRRDEVSIVAPATGASAGVTLDDAGTSYAKLTGVSAASALDGLTVFETISANVDDDGNDELVAVGLVGTSVVVRVVDSDENGMFKAVTEFKLDDAAYKYAHVRAADVDQDGRDEILVTAVKSDNHVVARVFDDAVGNFTLLDEVYAGAGEEIAAAFGNFDDDRAPELAFLVDTGSDLVLEVHDDRDHNYSVIKKLTNEDTGLIRGQGLVVSGLRLEAGNFDANLKSGNDNAGDQRDELVAFADGYDTDTESGGSGLYMRAFDDAKAGFAFLPNTQRDLPRPQPTSNYRYTQNWGFQTLVADANGDGQDEVFVLERQGGDTGDSVELRHETFGDESAKWTATEQVVTLASGVSTPNALSMASASGRDDSLGADVIVAVRQGTTVTPYRVRGEHPDVQYVESATTLPTLTVASASQPVWVTAGDWDADSLRLRYTGKKWLELTRPQPIIVVAAPPLKDGISQNYSNSGSEYGTAVTHSSEVTEEHSFTEKVTMSFEITVPVLDFLSAGAHAELSRQFTDTNTKTESVSTSISYASTYPDDIIVFRGTLCTRYEYVVVGGKEPSVVGTKMTIDVPLDHNTYKWTVPYYNETLGKMGSPIDSKILSHTAGDPTSYPTKTERNALHPLWQADQATPVGQGSGVTTTTIDLSTEQTNGSSYTTSSEYGGEVGAFVKAGYSQGWDDTSAYSVTTGKETHFVGHVGDISDKHELVDYLYNYGIFVYETKLAGGESVQVLDYWTELLGDGYNH